CVEQDDKGWDARKRAYCLKIQPATGSFARNLIYSTKPQQIKTLETLRDTLLPKLMSGDVRVQYAEEAIASVA
ncbi:restriction endonuclease subunit S, partial [Escherichia coli]|uniref:restriction endonuclease subunit S n=1 Tax=Escherichia coli TaxID=562 RepID=UPI0039062674